VLRLTLHVLAATIWVGGQFVVGYLMPTVRSFGGDATVKVARAFGRLSWPAFWVLVFTGCWNWSAVHGTVASSAWNTAFALKMLAVLAAGLSSYAHTKTSSARARGVTAGMGLLFSVVALVLGVALAG
jgi:putative copper export protein